LTVQAKLRPIAWKNQLQGC